MSLHGIEQLITGLKVEALSAFERSVLAGQGLRLESHSVVVGP